MAPACPDRAPLAVHCGSIRQTATILSMDKDCLRTGDKATVHFRFIKTPEYLHIDQRLVFREGRTKAVGTITKVRPGRSHPPPASTRGRGTLSSAGASREALGVSWAAGAETPVPAWGELGQRAPPGGQYLGFFKRYF